MQACIGEKQPNIWELQALTIASHFNVVMSPCHIYSLLSVITGFKSLISVIPRSAFLCCRYSSCIFRNSSLTGIGILTFIRERRRFSCSTFSAGILCMRILVSSFKRYLIKYILLSSCVTIHTPL